MRGTVKSPMPAKNPLRDALGTLHAPAQCEPRSVSLVPRLTETPGRFPDRAPLATEPCCFTERHLAEAESRFDAPAQSIDGETVSWYGSRAAAGLRYLARRLPALTGVRESQPARHGDDPAPQSAAGRPTRCHSIGLVAAFTTQAEGPARPGPAGSQGG